LDELDFSFDMVAESAPVICDALGHGEAPLPEFDSIL
jgi:hypothetical protein